MIRIAAGLALVAGLVTPEEATYYVGHHEKFSNITFESQADLETIIGTTNQVSGEITFDAEKGTGSVSLKVPVVSMKTGIDMRDQHLQSDQWLDAKKFPDLTFVSKKVEAQDQKGFYKVTGDFTMHGVTKEITVTVQARDIPEAAAQKSKFPPGRWMKCTSEFPMKLSDFGVKTHLEMPAKISDTWTVKMTLFAGTAKPEKK